MTNFSRVFRSAYDLAVSQGRKPVVCLLGPDMQAEFTDYCGDLSPFMKKMAKDDPWLKTVKPGDLGTLQGIRLRKMEAMGMAMLTAPAPESGFDLTP